MKRKRITKKVLILIGAILGIQSLPLVGGPIEKGSSPEIVDLSFEDGEVKISVNFHEPFRWEKTRYESIKKFPQPWIGSPDTPHEIWFEEKGVMEWRQTDMMFMGNYKVIGDSAKYVLDRYTENMEELELKLGRLTTTGT